MVWMKKEMTVVVMQKLAIEDDLKDEKRKIEEISYVFDIFKGTKSSQILETFVP